MPCWISSFLPQPLPTDLEKNRWEGVGKGQRPSTTIMWVVLGSKSLQFSRGHSFTRTLLSYQIPEKFNEIPEKLHPPLHKPLHSAIVTLEKLKTLTVISVGLERNCLCTDNSQRRYREPCGTGRKSMSLTKGFGIYCHVQTPFIFKFFFNNYIFHPQLVHTDITTARFSISFSSLPPSLLQQ